MSAHSPTPWRNVDGYICQANDLLTSVPIRPMKREWATDPSGPHYETAQANADFIVRAVNSHSKLLSAAKEAILVLAELGKAFGNKPSEMPALLHLFEAINAAEPHRLAAARAAAVAVKD